MGVMRLDLAMRDTIPVVMAGVLGIYALIVAVIIQGSIDPPNGKAPKYGSYTGFAHLAAGLCCGLGGLTAGMVTGVVGDPGVRAVGQQEKLFVNTILVLIFAEALGLHGLIVALILLQKKSVGVTEVANGQPQPYGLFLAVAADSRGQPKHHTGEITDNPGCLVEIHGRLRLTDPPRHITIYIT
ncbi:hypothetical protein PF005_g30428 [Phytophthora fragariae]|uniref:V-type proton ATPase proteolipid subunit n=1 Tax=Phytophthora fragariae TaxID=53985 RepID=A0A6A3E3N2_9STRA|nr:hypothetical protein PF003_g17392 [Phytophthora fragariae]KAE8928404.1 hypothetical protein PF009_g21448 [Phytophthora fragariae]KAE9061088.1 hypothetical protein PF010_g29952 [Phytophthora fragariae]KAE9061909.1 hypothetical protein PF007_g30093 [Phytophthora fragariae]KAE9067244.1 hypothetical protein PF006_g30035 [Phytophthora fragariae]